MEKEIKIRNGKIELTGLFEHNSHKKVAVITHPHPLYGGNMENPIVEILQEELKKNKYSTLRFNFRQVYEPLTDKDSQEDLNIAVNYLKEKGYLDKILICGYSYGSWISTLVIANGLKCHETIMISPPVGFLDYTGIKKISCSGLAVTGINDDIAPPELVKETINNLNPGIKLKTIKGCDHLYSGYTKELRKIISDYLLN